MTSAAASRIKAGIVGGTGYTGVELLRLLSQHPYVDLTAITSRKEDGMLVSDMFPNLRGRVNISFQTPEKAALRSEEHTSELQSLMRISYDVYCLKKNIT